MFSVKLTIRNSPGYGRNVRRKRWWKFSGVWTLSGFHLPTSYCNWNPNSRRSCISWLTLRIDLGEEGLSQSPHYLLMNSFSINFDVFCIIIQRLECLSIKHCYEAVIRHSCAAQWEGCLNCFYHCVSVLRHSFGCKSELEFISKHLPTIRIYSTKQSHQILPRLFMQRWEQKSYLARLLKMAAFRWPGLPLGRCIPDKRDCLLPWSPTFLVFLRGSRYFKIKSIQKVLEIQSIWRLQCIYRLTCF